MGTSVIPMQSYAGGSDLQHKSVGDVKDSVKKDAKSEKANQHLSQENACYRDDDCQQANEGQQIVGKDNEANGFNDQSANLPPTLSSNGAATGTGVGNGTAPTPTPTTATLNICKTVVNNATTSFQPSDITFTFATLANPNIFQGNNVGCTAVTVDPGTFTFTEFLPSSVTGFGVQSSGGCGITDSEITGPRAIIGGTIAAGETQTCSIRNTIV